LNSGTDESNPMSQFILHSLTPVADLQRGMIREQVIPEAKAKRKWLGLWRHVFRRDGR